ncbi:MAG: hypothetical protein ACREIC_22125, partial [Limisphaerales bacterium]
GGLVQEVIANGPVEVLSLDHDIEGGAQEHIRQIPQADSTAAECYVRFEDVTVDRRRVSRLWKAAAQPERKEGQ